jgi:hypothetical protein
MDESLWLIPCLLILLTHTLTDPLTHYLFSSLSDAHSAWLLIHYCTLTHGLVLYLDMDPPVYKSALDIPKTSDLTWLFSRPFPLMVTISVTIPYQELPCIPLASCNTKPFLKPSSLSALWNTKSFQKAPLSVALPSHLYHLLLPWKIGNPYLEAVLVQILRPYLQCGPYSSSYHVTLQGRPLDTLQLPQLYHSINWEHLAHHLNFATTNLHSSRAIKALRSFTPVYH